MYAWSFQTLHTFHFQDDIRRVKRDLEKSGAEKTDLTSKIEELNLYNDSSEKELRKIIRNKQVRVMAGKFWNYLSHRRKRMQIM